MTLTKKQILSLILLLALITLLPAAIFLSQKRQDIRPKADMPAEIGGSSLIFSGPTKVKVGEKFSIDLILDTTRDPQFTISQADAVVSINPQSLGPDPTICPLRPCPAYDLPPYYNQVISLVNVSPGKIFDSYVYPGSKTLPCGGIAGLDCPDGYYCSYGGANIKGLYPDQIGNCLPISYRPLPLQTGDGGSSQTTVTGTMGIITSDAVCIQDAKQCPDGSYVGRVPPRCAFSPCPGGPIGVTAIPNPPYYGGNQFKISGTKTFAVDDKGYFKGFIGKGTFATLNFVAKYPGKVEIGFIPGTSIKGYLVSQPASSQEPKERLLSNSPNLSIEVVSDQACIPRPPCLDGREDIKCILAEPPGGWCPPPITPAVCKDKSRGDANCDGKVDGIDFSIWLNSQCSPSGNQACSDFRADFNSDKRVDDEDYKIWFNNKGT